MDGNDVQFNEYSVDFFGFLKLLFSGDTKATVDTTINGGFGAPPAGAESVVAGWIDILASFWSIFVVLSWVFSFLLIFGIIYAYLKEHYYASLIDDQVLLQERLYQELYGGESKDNKRWSDALLHIASENPKDWRLAIIEADILLEETLKAAGYAGSTIGEMLKSASSQQFANLDQAWAAHLVRNKVAHAGSDFVLTKKLAQETITQYKMVFEEFDVI